jgi:hypothetical protein
LIDGARPRVADLHVEEFAASADLKEAMTKAGVLDTPTIYFLESID